jgi:hypothetical protein
MWFSGLRHQGILKVVTSVSEEPADSNFYPKDVGEITCIKNNTNALNFRE